MSNKTWKILQDRYSIDVDCSGYKPGDRVTVVYKVESLYNGWSSFWLDRDMTPRIGDVGTVVSLEGCSGIRVEFSDGSSYNFPYQCLKLV